MYIKGVGMTKFGAQTSTSQALVYEAAMEALDDAGSNINEIDAIVVAATDNETNGERQRQRNIGRHDAMVTIEPPAPTQQPPYRPGDGDLRKHR